LLVRVVIDVVLASSVVVASADDGLTDFISVVDPMEVVAKVFVMVSVTERVIVRVMVVPSVVVTTVATGATVSFSLCVSVTEIVTVFPATTVVCWMVSVTALVKTTEALAGLTSCLVSITVLVRVAGLTSSDVGLTSGAEAEVSVETTTLALAGLTFTELVVVVEAFSGLTTSIAAEVNGLGAIKGLTIGAASVEFTAASVAQQVIAVWVVVIVVVSPSMTWAPQQLLHPMTTITEAGKALG
jgi:hypothetical protein